MEWSASKGVCDPPGVATQAGTVLQETEVAEGNGGEYDGGVAGTGTVWSAVCVSVLMPDRLGAAPGHPRVRETQHW